MFRLIRTAILLLITFVAGMLFERNHQQELCALSGGEWMRAGLCAAKG